jgi:hypothetical protein
MVNAPEGSTLAGLAGTRVFGFPYTVTEYNHPAPNRYEAEGFPLIAALGSFQEWDGVFSFDYSGSAEDEADHFGGFFDIVGHPVKLAQQPACSDLFVRGRSARQSPRSSATLPLDERLDMLMRGPWSVNAYAGGVGRLAWLGTLVGLATSPGPDARPAAAPSDNVRWQVENGRGLATYVGDGCAGLIGFGAGKTLSANGISLTPGATSLDGFSVVLINRIGGGQLGADGRHLITAEARCWNPDMAWNKEGNSVGTQWGNGPTLCEGVPLSISVIAGGRVRLFALNPDGTRRVEVAAGKSTEAGVTGFRVGPEQQTLWYELTVGG